MTVADNAVTDATIFSATGATLTLSGPITKNGTTLTLTGGGRIVTTGGIGGALANSALVVDGVIHDLGGTISYNGPTTIQNSATLNLLNSNALPNSPDPLTNMTIAGVGWSFNLNGFSDSVASLSGSGTVTNTTGTASNLTVSPSSGTTTFSGSITGGANMSATKSGGGTQVFSGASSYTGATNINVGTLLVAAGGSLASTGAVNVNNGGTLAGAGSVGNITINSGATVAPAPGTGSVSAPGNLTAASATLMGGGIFNLQVNDALGGAGTGWDQLQLNSGAANISSLTPGNQFIVNLQSLTLGNVAGNAANFNSAVAYTWDFLNYGTLTGTFATNLFQLNTSAFTNSVAGTFSIVNNGGNTSLAVQYTPTVVAVPEPGSLLLTALASFGMAGYGYRRRRRAASETSDENGPTCIE